MFLNSIFIVFTVKIMIFFTLYSIKWEWIITIIIKRFIKILFKQNWCRNNFHSEINSTFHM